MLVDGWVIPGEDEGDPDPAAGAQGAQGRRTHGRTPGRLPARRGAVLGVQESQRDTMSCRVVLLQYTG